MCSAVEPRDSCGLCTPDSVPMSAEAPARRSSLTAAWLPLRAARCSAVRPEPAQNKLAIAQDFQQRG